MGHRVENGPALQLRCRLHAGSHGHQQDLGKENRMEGPSCTS
jgi:hypothetical protein